MMKNVHLFVIIFTVVTKFGHCFGVCGDDLTRYDDKTHDCMNETVVLRVADDTQLTTPSPKLLSCGKPPFVIKYDPIIEGCENYTVFRLEKPLPVSESSEKSKDVVLTKEKDHANVESGSTSQIDFDSVTEENVDRDIPVVICRQDDFLYCNRRVYCGGLDGYQCCGFDIYHPDHQTCCQMSSAENRIHNVPTSQYICCDLEVHSRKSWSFPCQHPAANDAFFGRIKRLKPNKLTIDSNLCLSIKYAYKIHIVKQPELENQRYLQSLVTRYDLNLADRKIVRSKKVRMNIAIDTYRPLRKISKKTFVVLTAHDHMSDTVFYLRPEDMLFRAPKKITNIRLEKMLQNILNNC